MIFMEWIIKFLIAFFITAASMIIAFIALYILVLIVYYLRGKKPLL